MTRHASRIPFAAFLLVAAAARADDSSNLARFHPGESWSSAPVSFTLGPESTIELWVRPGWPVEQRLPESLVLVLTAREKVVAAVLVADQSVGLLGSLEGLGKKDLEHGAGHVVTLDPNKGGTFDPMLGQITNLRNVLKGAHQLVFAMGPERTIVFVDGWEVGSVATPALPKDEPLTLHVSWPEALSTVEKRPMALTVPYEGHIGGIRVWDRALGQSSVNVLRELGHATVDPRKLALLHEYDDLVAWTDFTGEPGERALRLRTPLVGTWVRAGERIHRATGGGLEASADRWHIHSVYSITEPTLPPESWRGRGPHGRPPYLDFFRDGVLIGSLLPDPGDAAAWTLRFRFDQAPLRMRLRPETRAEAEAYLDALGSAATSAGVDRPAWRLDSAEALAWPFDGLDTGAKLSLVRPRFLHAGKLEPFSAAPAGQNADVDSGMVDIWRLAYIQDQYQTPFRAYNLWRLDPWKAFDTGSARHLFRVPTSNELVLDVQEQKYLPWTIKRFPTPGGSKTRTSVETAGSSSRVESDARRWGFNVGGMFKGVSGAFGQTRSVETETSTATQTREETVRAWAIHTVAALVLDREVASLSAEFTNAVVELAEDLRGLEGAAREKRLQRFFDAFGTHYAVTTEWGAIAEFTSKMTEEMRRTAMRVKEAKSREGKAGVGSGKPGANDLGGSGSSSEEKSLEEMFEASEKRSFDQHYVLGGSGSPDPNYSVSAGTNPVPIGGSLRPIGELLSPEHFDDPAIHDGLRTTLLAAAPRYVDDRWLEAVRRQTDDDRTLRAGRKLLELAQSRPSSGRGAAYIELRVPVLTFTLTHADAELVFDGRQDKFSRDSNTVLHGEGGIRGATGSVTARPVPVDPESPFHTDDDLRQWWLEAFPPLEIWSNDRRWTESDSPPPVAPSVAARASLVWPVPAAVPIEDVALRIEAKVSCGRASTKSKKGWVGYDTTDDWIFNHPVRLVNGKIDYDQDFQRTSRIDIELTPAVKQKERQDFLKDDSINTVVRAPLVEMDFGEPWTETTAKAQQRQSTYFVGVKPVTGKLDEPREVVGMLAHLEMTVESRVVRDPTRAMWLTRTGAEPLAEHGAQRPSAWHGTYMAVDGLGWLPGAAGLPASVAGHLVAYFPLERDLADAVGGGRVVGLAGPNHLLAPAPLPGGLARLTSKALSNGDGSRTEELVAFEVPGLPERASLCFAFQARVGASDGTLLRRLGGRSIGLPKGVLETLGASWHTVVITPDQAAIDGEIVRIDGALGSGADVLIVGDAIHAIDELMVFDGRPAAARWLSTRSRLSPGEMLSAPAGATIAAVAEASVEAYIAAVEAMRGPEESAAREKANAKRAATATPEIDESERRERRELLELLDADKDRAIRWSDLEAWMVGSAIHGDPELTARVWWDYLRPFDVDGDGRVTAAELGLEGEAGGAGLAAADIGQYRDHFGYAPTTQAAVRTARRRMQDLRQALLAQVQGADAEGDGDGTVDPGELGWLTTVFESFSFAALGSAGIDFARPGEIERWVFDALALPAPGANDWAALALRRDGDDLERARQRLVDLRRPAGTGSPVEAPSSATPSAPTGDVPPGLIGPETALVARVDLAALNAAEITATLKAIAPDALMPDAQLDAILGEALPEFVATIDGLRQAGATHAYVAVMLLPDATPRSTGMRLEFVAGARVSPDAVGEAVTGLGRALGTDLDGEIVHGTTDGEPRAAVLFKAAGSGPAAPSPERAARVAEAFGALPPRPLTLILLPHPGWGKAFPSHHPLFGWIQAMGDFSREKFRAARWLAIELSAGAEAALSCSMEMGSPLDAGLLETRFESLLDESAKRCATLEKSAPKQRAGVERFAAAARAALQMDRADARLTFTLTGPELAALFAPKPGDADALVHWRNTMLGN